MDMSSVRSICPVCGGELKNFEAQHLLQMRQPDERDCRESTSTEGRLTMNDGDTEALIRI